MAPIALAFAVLDLTGSKTDLGIVLAANWVPQLFLVLFGGVFADRLPRHLVMVGSNAISAAAQGAIAALLLTGTARLWQLIALQVLRGAAFSFFFPASQGLVPETVRPTLLQQANVLLGMSRNATNVLGAALGGVLVAAASPGWALAFDAATYLSSAAVLAAMRLPGRARTVEAPNVVRELAEGWTEFARGAGSGRSSPRRGSATSPGWAPRPSTVRSWRRNRWAGRRHGARSSPRRGRGCCSGA